MTGYKEPQFVWQAYREKLKEAIAENLIYIKDNSDIDAVVIAVLDRNPEGHPYTSEYIWLGDRNKLAEIAYCHSGITPWSITFWEDTKEMNKRYYIKRTDLAHEGWNLFVDDFIYCSSFIKRLVYKLLYKLNIKYLISNRNPMSEIYNWIEAHLLKKQCYETHPIPFYR